MWKRSHISILLFSTLLILPRAGFAVINCYTGTEIDSIALNPAYWDSVPNGDFSDSFNSVFTIWKAVDLDPDDWSDAKLDSFADFVMNDLSGNYTPESSYAYRTAKMFGVNQSNDYPDIEFDYVWKGSHRHFTHFDIKLWNHGPMGGHGYLYIGLPDGVYLTAEEIAKDHFAHEWAHVCYNSTGATAGDGCTSFGEDYGTYPCTWLMWDWGTHEFMAKSSEFFNGMVAENWYGDPASQPFAVSIARNDWYEDCQRVYDPSCGSGPFHVKGDNRRWIYFPFTAYLQEHFNGATDEGLLHDWIHEPAACDSESTNVGPHDFDYLAVELDHDLSYSGYFQSTTGDTRLSELFQEYALSMWVNSDHLFDDNPDASVHMPLHSGANPRDNFNFFNCSWCPQQPRLLPFPAFVGTQLDSVIGPLFSNMYPDTCGGSAGFARRRELVFDSYALNYMPFIADSTLWNSGRCYDLEIDIVLDDEYQCFNPGDYVTWTGSDNDVLHFYVLGYPGHTEDLDTHGDEAVLLDTYEFKSFDPYDVIEITAPCFGSVYKSVVLVATLTEQVASSGMADAHTVPFYYRFKAQDASGDVNILSSATWPAEDGPICLGGLFTVANFGTLTVDPGVQIWCANPDSSTGVGEVGFEIHGKLDLVGSAGDSIRINPIKDYWDGIVVESGGELLMDYVSSSGMKALDCESGSDLAVVGRSSLYLANGATGFDFRAADSARVADCEIDNATQILLTDQTLESSRIHQRQGQAWTAVTLDGDATLNDVVIYSAKTSIKCTAGDPALSQVSANSDVFPDCSKGATYGLIAEGSADVSVDLSTFDGFCKAIRVDDTAQVELRNSVITDAEDVGIYIKGSDAVADLGFNANPPVSGMEGLNCISTLDSTHLRVFNRSRNHCMASWNYWGTANPTSSIFSGSVGWALYDTTCSGGSGGPDFSIGQVASSGLTKWGLSPPRPNPFNPTCELSFTLPTSGASVSLAVYDLSGRRLRTLFSSIADGREHHVQWNGHDERGHPVSSGVYFACLQIGSELRSRKLVVLK